MKLLHLVGLAFGVASIFTSALDAALTGTALAPWTSTATGSNLQRVEYAPDGLSIDELEEDEGVPTIIYLLNLAAPRMGTDSDEAIIEDFVEEGMVVITLDYAGHENARVPTLNPDIQEMRREVLFNEYTSTFPIDQSALFIIPSGHRLKRDVIYDATGFTRGLDIIYPSNPVYPSAAIMEFSCDNKNRMGNYSMFAIRDTLLEGQATEGFAVVMADHPVPINYGGIDRMPESARRVKAAVRTLRAQSQELDLSGKIAVMGFSRGSGMALMAVTTAHTTEFDGYYENVGVDDSVQGALIMSGRFTYLDLLPTDDNLEKYRRLWGDPETNFEKWKAQGALDYLETAPTFPIFLELNAGEAVDEGEKSDAMHQMEVIQKRLTELGADFTFVMEEEVAGHKMPIDPAVVSRINEYFKARLIPTNEAVVSSLWFQATRPGTKLPGNRNALPRFQ